MKKVFKTKSFLVALAIIIGLIFFNLPDVSKKVNSFFYSIVSPIQKKSDNFAKQIISSWKFLKFIKNISKENTVLKDEIYKLTSQNTQLQELTQENEILRSYLNLPSFQRHQIDLANIIGRDFYGLEKYILIDKGRLHNIKKNMPIIVFENILIGKTIEIFDNFSKVLLITSPNSKIPCLIQETRTEGLVRGIKKDILYMDLVSKNIVIEKNQTVITSGIDDDFPKGLLIGKISKVESSENKIFQEIEIIPIIEVKNLEKVFIITK